ncbi:DUF2339 domain-containing protein [Cohnella yongneupensis]|uniref:DUF2339 domain-containing protein n=1 Tax=Cohnella yongneupensis TaxID=425006 RepID=A0ABW0R3P1_9BACL
METIVRKHWTSLLGVLFVLSAFITLFKYSLDEGWITDVMKIGFGLLCGTGLSVAGLEASRKRRSAYVSQIVLGLGACVLYATFSFAGIYYGLWSPMTVLIGMTAVTAGVTAFSYRFGSRLLMNISLAGGLLSPLLMQPETDQVFSLFIYLFVINAAFFSISVAKRWSELRVHAFIGTWIIYAAYFVHYNPPVDGLWSMPLRYALAAFAFYAIGFMIASWRSNRCFDGWSMYLSLANGILFGCWAINILQDDLPYSVVIALLGAVFIGTGMFMLRLVGKADSASVSHMLAGMLLLLLASSSLGSGLEAKPLVNVFVWGGIAGLLALVGQVKHWMSAAIASVVIWTVVGIYWFVETWDAPRGEWFGTFIPFLNWGAMAWVLLAAIGFYYAMRGIVVRSTDNSAYVMSMLFALLSHLIVGGLLTVQIQNVFLVYFDEYSDQLLQLSLTVSWGIYALLLYLWGAHQRQILFRIFGSVVLVLVAIKAIFMDLQGEEALYKVFVLLVLGGISFLITWVNAKWRQEEGNPQSDISNG